MTSSTSDHDGNVPPLTKEFTCKFEERAGAEICTASRAVKIGQIGSIEVMRRSDLGVAMVIAQIDEPAANALEKRWGNPSAEGMDGENPVASWCSADGNEGAFLQLDSYFRTALVTIAATNAKAKDLIEKIPIATAQCSQLRATVDSQLIRTPGAVFSQNHSPLAG